jgi:uncharacterized protein (TIGR00255 family)
MKSMTGYAAESCFTVWSDTEIAVKSVNGRFLEIRCHLPKEMAAFEPQIRKLIQAEIKRGTVEVTINRRPHARTLKTQIEMKTDLAKQWLSQFKKLQTQLNVPGDVPMDLLVRSLDVLHVEERYPVGQPEAKIVLSHVKRATGKLQAARSKEGQALQKDLRSNLGQLAKLLKKMQAQAKGAKKILQQQIWNRYLGLKSQFEVDERRLAQEVAVLVERGDISEELVRLKQHITAVGQLLKVSHPVGKKLDFYMQELLREVNTIGSKSQLASLTALVVESKVVVEKLREQVQNIE